MNIKSLKQGSKIAIAAPAGRIYPPDLAFAIDWIQANGWECIYSEEIFGQYNFGYAYAGTDEHRTNHLQQYLDDDSIDAIWFARGGYGSAKIIDRLDFTRFKEHPKWLIGYSDITVFHNHINNLGIPTLHAVTAKPLNTPYTPKTYTSLAAVLEGEHITYQIPSQPFNIEGKTQGKLVGGNLSIIYSLLGSESFIQGKNLILFIEDWQENWYHLDRMLTALKRSNLLNQLQGLLVGSFTKMDTKEENLDYNAAFDAMSNQIIHSFAKDLQIPVAFNFPAGHIGDHWALRMGSEWMLSVDADQVQIECL